MNMLLIHLRLILPDFLLKVDRIQYEINLVEIYLRLVLSLSMVSRARNWTAHSEGKIDI